VSPSASKTKGVHPIRPASITNVSILVKENHVQIIHLALLKNIYLFVNSAHQDLLLIQITAALKVRNILKQATSFLQTKISQKD